MADVDAHGSGTTLLDARALRVIVGGGAMDTRLRAVDVTRHQLDNLEGGIEIPNEIRTDVIETKYVGLQIC